MRRIVLILSACFFLSAAAASAQTIGTPQSPLQFQITPEVPGPNEQVLIEAQGVGGFLGNASITWQVNGKTLASGVGQQTFSFTTGALGTQTKVHVIINSPTQGTLTKDFTFSPSQVDLVWEADTSAPPWYLSKPLYSAGSRLTVFAFPQIAVGGTSASLSSLTYNWSRNGTPLPNQSGLGRSSITFDGNELLANETVDVDVLLGATLRAHAEVVIPASKPRLTLYEQDPLRGVIYDAALPSVFSLTSQEITVAAQPYFFANQSLAGGSLPFSWTLNGSAATGPQSAQGILTLRQAGSGAGKAALSVSLQNTDSSKYLQSAQAAADIVFGQNASGSGASLFGL